MLVPKDAYGRVLDPGDIVLHTRRGHGKPRRMVVHAVQVRRCSDYGHHIINRQRVECFPVDDGSRWRPSIIRRPENLVILQKWDEE